MSDQDKATPPVPPTPYRLGEWTWNSIFTRYEAGIYFSKVGSREKITKHSLGILGLKDHFSHPNNPDFEPYSNLSELDYKAIGERFLAAVNSHDQLVAAAQAALAVIPEQYSGIPGRGGQRATSASNSARDLLLAALTSATKE